MKSHVTLRLTAPIVIISVLLLIMGIIAAWYVQSVDHSNSEIFEQNVSSLQAAQEFELGIREIRTQLNQYLLTGDRKYLEGVPVLRKQTDDALAKAERLATTEGEQILVVQMKQGYQRFIHEFERHQQKGYSSGLDRDVRALSDDVLTGEILQPAHEYLNLNMEMAILANKENKRLANWTIGVLFFLGIAGAGVGLVAGLGIAQRFHQSIVKLNLTIQDAAGKLDEATEPVLFSPEGDLPEMELALSKMSDRISSVVRQLQESQREVLRAEQLAALGQLAAGLAHEFRNPLTAIKILVQSAASQGEAGQLSGNDLTILENEISRLEYSIQTFLDFARPPRLEKRGFELRGVIEQTLNLLAARARNQSVYLEATLPAEAIPLEADQGQIRQVLLNLLLNALDVLPQGGTIGVVVLTGQGFLTVRVTDTGPGLSPAVRDRIFEPFVSTKETGLGLGLSICKLIIEAHGGTITAGTRPEGGAVFTIELPIRREG